MIISVNYIPEMHRAFETLDKESVRITYTVGGTVGRSQRRELIIRNW